MSLKITSYVPAFAGGTPSVGDFRITAPNIFGTTTGGDSITLPIDISDVNGLQGALNDKLRRDGTVPLIAPFQLDGNQVWLSPLGHSRIVAPDESTVDISANDVLSLTITDTQLNARNKPIINVTDPVSAQDAATKNYVDTAASPVDSVFGRIGSITANAGDYSADQIDFSPAGDISSITVQSAIAELDVEKLSLSGGTLSGSLDLNGNTLILDADADSSIIPSEDSFTINLGGAPSYTFTGTQLSMLGNPLVNLADPTNPQDAATMNYVDSNFLPLTGGELSGSLTLLGVPRLAFDSSNISTIYNTGNFIEINGNATPGGITTYVVDGFASRIQLGSASSEGIRFRTAVSGLSGGTISPIENLDLLTTVNEMRVPLLESPGTVLNPAFSFISDADTGIYSPGSNQIAITAGGINHIKFLGGQIDALGNSIINPLDPTAGNHVGDRDFNDARYTQISNNLSEVNASIARTNLGLSTVAATGDYNDLLNLPSIPSQLNDLSDVDIGTPGAIEDGFLMRYNDTLGVVELSAETISSVFGRTGNVVAVAGDYNASQVDFTPIGGIGSTDVQAAIVELDSEKLDLSGGTMTGTLTMSGNNITNVGIFGAGSHTIIGSVLSTTLGGNGYRINSTSTPSATTPSYSFVSQTATGMYWDGLQIGFSVAGIDQLNIGASGIDVQGNRITALSAPTAGTDAVNLDYLEGQNFMQVLGSASGIDLLVTGYTNIYTVPAGEQHVVSRVIYVTTSYTPGISPSNPTVSIGTDLASSNQIVANTVLDWGGASGSADTMDFTDTRTRAVTPNAGDDVNLRVETAAGGSFSSLTISVFVLGFKM